MNSLSNELPVLSGFGVMIATHGDRVLELPTLSKIVHLFLWVYEAYFRVAEPEVIFSATGDGMARLVGS